MILARQSRIDAFSNSFSLPSLSIFRPMIPRSVFVLFISAVFSHSADWPQWRGPDRTGHVPESQATIAAIPDDPKIVWKLAIGEGFASPVVAGGKVFYVDNQDAQEVAHAVEAATGKELWKETVYASHKDGFGIGPRTTPVADGDRVYFQSAKGEFQCRAAENGALKWRTNFVDNFEAVYVGEKGNAAGASRHGATGSPIIDGENIIVQVGSSKGASIVAFNKLTGDVVWKSQDDQTSYAAPIIATIAGQRQFVAFTVDGLIGLNLKDGKLLWRRAMTTRLGRHVTTPVVVDDLVIVASHQLGLVATRIVKEGENFTAQEAWLNKDILTNFSSPVVVGTYLYGLGSKKDIICVDGKTGSLAWSETGIVNTSAEQAEAAFMVIGKNVAVLTDSGEFVLFAADSKEFKEAGRAQVCGKTWCNPAFVDGQLYLRDAKELLRVSLQ